ncbi:OmpA family protein [Erythrobacter litoralis]|jgi:outer membrane protein OmpA-like peptidoglycan-associated protein|uniref:OmpA family protein n=1 Tax=Erythrobacter litoralis TaxID=39960 RepID=A0A074NLX3_9SPHN|nr:OmpA family protein [Erythrobacter litoralis]AOL23744.1 OmpA family protein [Erythrobacter litoralis]KEO98772.1 OmpA family protein [Erythrobacter litoralis]MEE4338164.1 OmpA family protein [Erythrobacter sp.]
MSVISKRARLALFAGAAALVPASGAFAQEEMPQRNEEGTLATVYGSPPSDLEGLPEGPQIEGVITARNGSAIQVTSTNGSETIISVGAGTTIKSSGGFLGLDKDRLGPDALLRGLPVKVDTVQWGQRLLASDIDLKSRDLRTASMIDAGTRQQFAEQGAAIEENAAVAEALRGRVANIDQYNVKGTTNVYFDTGKYNLSGTARNDLCQFAQQAQEMDNALLLVVGYTDTTGSYEINQELSEKRAGRVTNFLQQQCKWEPWRMLTPTGMATADPAADNSTEEGRAQNRRVAVNILVSKSVDGM